MGRKLVAAKATSQYRTHDSVVAVAATRNCLVLYSTVLYCRREDGSGAAVVVVIVVGWYRQMICRRCCSRRKPLQWRCFGRRSVQFRSTKSSLNGPALHRLARFYWSRARAPAHSVVRGGPDLKVSRHRLHAGTTVRARPGASRTEPARPGRA